MHIYNFFSRKTRKTVSYIIAFFNQLEENYGKEEITREIQNWTAAQWIDYISKRDGVMTAEEFHDFGITELKKRYK